MSKAKQWRRCAKCGTYDKTRLDNTTKIMTVGTLVTMVCPDCTDLCRKCCPTEHGTKFEEVAS